MPIQPFITRSTAVWGNDTKLYRYVLYREWDKTSPNAVIIGLNPSSADEQYDDRTVRKCIEIVRRNGYGSLTMLNIFALRATNPKFLLENSNPIGCNNDYYIQRECQKADVIIVAWGKHGKIRYRHHRLLELLTGKMLYCLGINKDGTPKHPLYIKTDIKWVKYR